MESPHIPHDDLMDVLEMTNKIESYISNILKDNDHNLAISALMNASVNSMIGQCKTLSEVMFCRTLFIQILDISIKSIEWKKPEEPSS